MKSRIESLAGACTYYQYIYEESYMSVLVVTLEVASCSTTSRIWGIHVTRSYKKLGYTPLGFIEHLPSMET